MYSLETSKPEFTPKSLLVNTVPDSLSDVFTGRAVLIGDSRGTSVEARPIALTLLSSHQFWKGPVEEREAEALCPGQAGVWPPPAVGPIP